MNLQHTPPSRYLFRVSWSLMKEEVFTTDRFVGFSISINI